MVYAFWSSVMLVRGRYMGNPVVKHRVIEGMQPQLLERGWRLLTELAASCFDDSASLSPESTPFVRRASQVVTTE